MFPRLLKSDASAAVILIRLSIGAVFLSEGIQKFLYPDARGVGRFEKMGFEAAEFLASMVGTFEIVCGALVILGLLTRFAAVPLICIMLAALLTTKLPTLLGHDLWGFHVRRLSTYGFWSMAHEMRTDFAMLLGAVFLLIVGGGKWSLDALFIGVKADCETESIDSLFNRIRDSIVTREEVEAARRFACEAGERDEPTTREREECSRSRKAYGKPSVFTPEGLLREARRQKAIPPGDVPEVCLLDPDGDLSRHLIHTGARRNPHWACYHTVMLELETRAGVIGVVGCVVGASFAVLVAEQMFASGCKLLISITSAGQLVPAGEPPYFILIDRALRDEGTSYHYLPASDYTHIPQATATLGTILLEDEPRIFRGGAWTTDAPFRETEEAITFAKSEGLLAVEMEAAALYAFAEAKAKPVICFAHVTNRMATVENDFEKGEADGNKAMMDLAERTARIWRRTV